jgi:hypothetical protein
MGGSPVCSEHLGMRRIAIIFFSALALAAPATALAGGGNYTIAGGTSAERTQVHAALDASSFNWGLIPQAIQIHVAAGIDSYSTPGHVYLDADLLDSGRFGWATVQHEMGHQVDFFLLDDAKRATLNAALGGRDWCYGIAGLKHSDYGCERFASELAWAYWSAPDNAMRPHSTLDEAGAMGVVPFRALVAQLIGMPATVSTPIAVKVFAPKAKPAAKHKRP